MRIVPLTNRVLIEKKFTEKIGSIFLPEGAVPESQMGVVSAVGEYVTNISPGDTVYFPKYTGTNFKIGDKDYFVIEQEYVLASKV